MMRRLGLAALAAMWPLLLPCASLAQNKPSPKSLLARHLAAAEAIDSEILTLRAKRDAQVARYATASSTFAGSPFVAGSTRSNTRGLSTSREVEGEIGGPLWLPNQRQAFSQTVETGVEKFDRQIILRRLALAGDIRESWWQVQRARSDLSIAQSRLKTAQEIRRETERRAELGDVAERDTLLTQNEVLAAEVEVAQAEAALAATRAAYRLLTNGGEADGSLEPGSVLPKLEQHPALLSSKADIARSLAELDLVNKSRIENPELTVFGRKEAGDTGASATTIGMRLRVPLPTSGRNAPRIADAQSELARAEAEFAQKQRLLKAGVVAAQAALNAAVRLEDTARRRLEVADLQLATAQRAYQLGEISLFDLYRTRQLQQEAARGAGMAGIDRSLAHSRLRQAHGALP